MTRRNFETCPSGPLLQRLMLGQLAEIESDTIETHLQTCAACRLQLDKLSDSELLSEWQAIRQQDNCPYPFLAPPNRTGDLGSIDHYAIERVLGRGGSGVVFCAVDLELERPVAVKVLAFDLHHRATERFLRESRSAARLAGDHIVTVFATGTTIDNRPYLVMPLVVGESLRERLLRELPDPKTSARLIRDAALGLATIHASGTVHRDVKPANILIDSETGRARVTDFGLARADHDQPLTQSDVLCGTPEYMSPEQAVSSSEPTIASDIYSLGISLYECVTESTPFRGRPLQVLEQHRQSEPIRPSRLNPSTPRDLETICLKALSKSPTHRYSSAISMADDLERFLTGRPILARETTRLERLRMWSNRNRLLATVSAVSLGLLLLLAIGSTVAAIQLSRANTSILEQQTRLETAEQKAIQDRTAALESLDRLVDSLYDDLSKNSATIKTRELVVTAVIEGLNSLAQIKGDRASDRTALKAHSRIADLYSLQGSAKKAEQAYHASILLARSLANSQPEDANAQLELAKTLEQLALHLARSLNFENSMEIQTEADMILNGLLATNPNDVAALRQLVISHSRNLDYLWQNSSPEETLKVTQTAIDDVNRLLELETDNSENFQIANDLHSRLGRAWLESGNLAQAEIEFNFARDRIDRAAALAGNDPNIQFQSAVTHRMRGVLLNSLGRQDESLASLGLALASFQNLADADPNDLMLQQNVANTMLLMVPVETALGKIEDAIVTNELAIETYNQSLPLTDQTTLLRSLLVQAHLSLAGLQERQRDWKAVIRHAAIAIQHIEGGEIGSPLQTPGIEMAKQAAETTAQSARHMLEPSMALEDPVEVVSTLIVLAAIEAADNSGSTLSESTKSRMKRLVPESTPQSLVELVEHIHSLATELPAFQMTKDFHAARIWGLRARKLSESLTRENADEQTNRQQSVAECVGQAMEHLAKFAKDFPAVAFEVYKEPDFIWLRNTRQFQNAGLVLSAADSP